MLSEAILWHLAKGQAIHFHRSKKEKTFSLSPTQFHPQWKAYRQCLASMLPYSLEQVDKFVFYYPSNKARLTSAMKKSLDKVARYAVAQGELEEIRIRSFAGNQGSGLSNYKMSLIRANKVRRYLLSRGVLAQQIRMIAFGERNPSASNKRAKGRALNRRVEVIVKVQS